MKTNKEQKRIHLSMKVLRRLSADWKPSFPKGENELTPFGYAMDFLDFVEKEISTSKK